MDRSRVVVMSFVIAVAHHRDSLGRLDQGQASDVPECEGHDRPSGQSGDGACARKVIEGELEKKHDMTVWKVEVVSADNKHGSAHRRDVRRHY
ncbi:MAG: hypothetical protein A4E19_12925 [Nitrospira sp. SG-bin1]|nr:MAG: hypothetical protein A4E19_12925 [Nitrospira sp. SG-bin1]